MAETIDDEFLVEEFSRGDESAFDRIVERYSTDVGALANRLLGWPGEVEDVSQEVFVAAYLGLKRFRCECSLKSWLFTITINKCRSHRRKHLLHLRTFLRAADKAPSPSATPAHKNPMDAETFNRVKNAVAALPAKFREPIVIATEESLPKKMISRVYEIPALVHSACSARSLVRAMQESIEPESWFNLSDTGEGTIGIYMGNKPAIRQTRDVHRRPTC